MDLRNILSVSPPHPHIEKSKFQSIVPLLGLKDLLFLHEVAGALNSSHPARFLILQFTTLTHWIRIVYSCWL